MLLQDPAALVERLRAGDIEARERAEAELVRIGAPAEAALDEASRDADPEVAARARGLLLRAVAAHRGEVLRELRHIGRHLSDAARYEHADQILALTGALRRMDPEHPLAKEFTIRGLWSMERDFRHPARDQWAQVRGKVAEDIEDASYHRSCEACVTHRLMTAKVGFSFENAKVEDILAHLREVEDVNLILDAGVSNDPRERQLELAVTLEVKDVTLAEALRRVLQPYGMGFRVTAEGVVLLGWKEPE